jgi:hypothetical protein
MYAQPKLSRVFSFSADTRLDRQSKNSSWYCSWLIFTDIEKSAPFLQVGLIRLPENNFRLTPFITTQRVGEKLYFRDLRYDLAEGFHTIWIRRVQDFIFLGVDSKELYQARERDFFPTQSRRYLQIGAEVVRPLDSIYSEFKNLKLDGRPYEPKCAFADRGIAFQDDQLGFFVSGQFVSSKPRYFFDPTNSKFLPGCPLQ